MYNELADDAAAAAGSSSSSCQQQQGAVDPNRQGYTNQRINDALADAPFLDDDLMEGGGGGGAPGAEDVTMEEEEAAPESPKNISGVQKSPEVVKSPDVVVALEKSSPGVQEPSESIDDAPDASRIAHDVEGQEEDVDDDAEEPLAPTQLGTALDSLMMNWCQLLTNVTVKAPVPPPSTLDHVKEVAEVCSKHFRDASVDVNNELTRLGVQWEMEETAAQSAVEEANLDEAIERQRILLQQATDIIRTRVETYEKECPDAGKLLNT